MGEKHPYYGKGMSTNFPGSAHAMGFVILSRTMGYLWENSCISRMMKYITGWESNGKKDLYYGKTMGTNFPDSPRTVDFVAFSHAMENLWKNPSTSHVKKCTKRWKSNGKKHPYYGKSMTTNFHCLTHLTGFVAFSRAMARFVVFFLCYTL